MTPNQITQLKTLWKPRQLEDILLHLQITLIYKIWGILTCRTSGQCYFRHGSFSYVSLVLLGCLYRLYGRCIEVHHMVCQDLPQYSNWLQCVLGLKIRSLLRKLIISALSYINLWMEAMPFMLLREFSPMVPHLFWSSLPKVHTLLKQHLCKDQNHAEVT